VTISNAYTGDAGTPIALTGITGLTDTDGSESLSLTLSNFPAGSTFNAGHVDPDNSAHWIVDSSAITSLNGGPLAITTPSDYAGGPFNLHVDATVTDTATLQNAQQVSDVHTFSNDIAVAVDKLTANNDTITNQATFTENSDTTFATSVLLVND